MPEHWFSSSYFACEWKAGKTGGIPYTYDYGLYATPRQAAGSQPAQEPAAKEAD